MPPTSQALTPVSPGFVSIATAAKYLGVSEVSIRRALEDKRLKKHRLGRKVLIRYADLDALVAAPTPDP